MKPYTDTQENELVIDIVCNLRQNCVVPSTSISINKIKGLGPSGKYVKLNSIAYSKNLFNGPLKKLRPRI